MIKAVLTTESKDAKSVSASLSVDNEGFDVETHVKDGKIVSNFTAKNLRSLINTLDDIVNCQIVAEKTIR